jgi:hypothetical protein
MMKAVGKLAPGPPLTSVSPRHLLGRAWESPVLVEMSSVRRRPGTTARVKGRKCTRCGENQGHSPLRRGGAFSGDRGWAKNPGSQIRIVI